MVAKNKRKLARMSDTELAVYREKLRAKHLAKLRKQGARGHDRDETTPAADIPARRPYLLKTNQRPLQGGTPERNRRKH